MSFYFLRFPSRQVCALAVLGGGTAVAAYEMWDAVRTRRAAVPLFNSAAVVRTEESARYPCERLRGFDVVVRSYYVPSDPASEAGDRSNAAQASAPALPSRFRRFLNLFSNSTHKVSDDTTLAAHTDAAASVRVVVRDATDAAALSRKEGATGSLIAASGWPAHTSKYAALVLEPATRGRRSSSSNDDDAGANSGGNRDEASSSSFSGSRSLLRQLADGATHQSLVRCNPRSTVLDMACEADPAYLGAPYLRVLLSGFCLLPSTVAKLNVAVLGVGGGSLPLFLQSYFASRLHRCDLVDVEPMCFKAAVEQLGLKEELNTVALRREGGGVHYYVEDAVQYLQQRVGAYSSSSSTSGSSGSGTRMPAVDTASLPSGGVVTPEGAAVHASTPVFDTLALPHTEECTTTIIAPPTTIHNSTSSSSSSSITSSSSRRQQQLDLLFVDLFVGSELDSAVTSTDFLQLCRAALSPYGVAAFNLPAADKGFVQRCGVVFGDSNVFRIPVPASSNEVVLVRGGAGSRSDAVGPELSHRHLYRRAQELTAQYRLPYDLANHYPIWWRLW